MNFQIDLDNPLERDRFLNNFAKKSYTEMFDIRSRLGQTKWSINLLPNFRDKIFSRENKYPHTKNGLYIHIPFCFTRCEYCPYFSEQYNPGIVSEYVDALEKEIMSVKDTPYIKTTTFSTLYLGGGTPSLLSVDEIGRISEVINKSFTFENGAEWSFEGNPATFTEDKIGALKSAGFNRVSMGVQTFHDHLLKENGCAHNAERARKTIQLLLKYDLLFNIDMIYGLLGQTQDDFEEDIDELCQYEKLQQLTLYALKIVDNTPLSDELQKRDGFTAASHYKRLLEYDALAEEKLLAHQYKREEHPMFFSKGSALHRYISTETRVVGLGAGAGTIIDEGEVYNNYDLKEYISAINENRTPVLAGYKCTQQQNFERFILYRIIYMHRSAKNFHKLVEKRFSEYFNTSIGDLYFKVIDDMKKRKFIVKDTEDIVFTDRMWDTLGRIRVTIPSII